MFIERLLNQGNAPLIEQAVRFSAARHQILTDNVANIDTDGYAQRDLSVSKFQQQMQERIEQRRDMPPGTATFSDILPEVEEIRPNILFHDGGNRSMEQLMADSAKNAMYHNMMVELLRKQIGSIENALKERIA